jgi:hypothetical protein
MEGLKARKVAYMPLLGVFLYRPDRFVTDSRFYQELIRVAYVGSSIVSHQVSVCQSMGGRPAGELGTYQMRRGTRSVAGRLEIVRGWVVLDLQSQLTYNGLRT